MKHINEPATPGELLTARVIALMIWVFCVFTGLWLFLACGGGAWLRTAFRY